MDFVRYADSLRAKLHMGGVKLPVMIGITAAVLVVLALAGFGIASALGSNAGDFTISHKEDASAQKASEDSEAAATGSVFVHVGGAVAAPGLYELQTGSRVQQAIDAAGGFTDAAAADALNLARVVTDGEQIIVPEAASAQPAQGIDPSAASANASSGTTGKVNINCATADELQQLNGVGPALAQRIVDDRKANGAFAAIEDLKRVSGIGDKKFASLADSICVG